MTGDANNPEDRSEVRLVGREVRLDFRSNVSLSKILHYGGSRTQFNEMFAHPFFYIKMFLKT